MYILVYLIEIYTNLAYVYGRQNKHEYEHACMQVTNKSAYCSRWVCCENRDTLYTSRL
jgi:hypothetical protein